MNRYKEVRKASILGILGNILLFITKLIASIISKSEGMLADTFNSGADILSSLITFIGNKIASKPIDEDHNLGHGKAEYIFSLIISLLMIVFSLGIIKTSVKSIIYKEKLIFSSYIVIVCIITIIIKLALYIYTNRISKEQNNLLMKANTKDHRNDILLTSLNLISILLTRINIYYIDGFIGIFISVWIIVSSVKIFIESYDVLMDKTISIETKNEVLKIVDNHKEIKKVQHFNATPIGYKYQISLTIFVDGNLSTFESHKIADDLEKEITSKIDEIYLVVIHVNPI